MLDKIFELGFEEEINQVGEKYIKLIKQVFA